MTAREYLEQAITLDEEINSKLMIKSQLWALATKVTSSLSKGAAAHSQNDHQLEEIIAKMVDMEAEINADVDRLVDLKKSIMDAIREVPDADCRVFLEKRYLAKMKINDIAKDKFYGPNWGMTEHRKALAMIEPILREKKLIDS